MQVFESREVRHFIGRLDRGERIPEALSEFARDRRIETAWIQAIGALEWVELVEYDQVAKAYREPRRIDRAVEILSFVGNISKKDGQPFVHLHAALSYEADEEIKTVGGHVIDGSVFACEFRILAHDDLELTRLPHEGTGLHLWEESAAKKHEARREEQKNSWAQVAAASEWASKPPAPTVYDSPRAGHSKPARTKPSRPPVYIPENLEPPPPKDPLPEKRRVSEEEFFEEPIPQVGDFVDHRQFGLCRVDGEDEDGGLIIRLSSGARRTIKLDYLRVLPSRVDDANGRKIFPLEPKKK